MARLAVFASGNGSNMENLYSYFKDSISVQIILVCTNNHNAGVVEKCKNKNIPIYVFSKNDLENGSVENALIKHKIDWIILAGFLLKISDSLVATFNNKIINIHPSLLPKFGGKGMYGKHVHKAVISAGESESGITIHYVNNLYDSGKIIFQKKCLIEKGDTYDVLAEKIQKLEHVYFPKIIEQIINKKNTT